MQFIRTRDLERFRKVWEKAQKSGRIAILVGPSGSGKGYLVRKFAEDEGIRLLQYRAEESERNVPLGTIRRFANVNFPRVLLGRYSTDTLFRRIAEEMEKIRPVIVHIKEIHNADHLSLRFLHYLSVHPVPGVLVAVSYPKGMESMELSENLEHLVMNGLADVVIVDDLRRDELEESLRGTELEGIVDEIYEVSRGNPAMLDLIDLCRRETGTLVKSREEGFRCVWNLLNEFQRNLLKVGSTMGNFFWTSVVRDVLGTVPREDVNRLKSLGIISEFSSIYRGSEYRGYLFTSSEFRRFCYSMLTDEERRRYHLQVGRAIERKKIYIGWERIFELARHYSIASEPGRAIPYLRECVDISLHYRDHRSAVHHLGELERLLNMRDDPSLRVWTYHNFIRALGKVGRGEDALRYGDKLRSLALLEKAMVRQGMGDYREAISLCAECRGSDEFIDMVSYRIEAECLFRLGLYRNAMEVEMRHIEMARELNNDWELAMGYKNIGNVHVSMRNLDDGERYYRMAMKIFRALRDLKGISSIYNNLGIIYSDRGLAKKALEHYRRSLEIEEKLRDYDGMATSYNNIGTAYVTLGDVYEALEAYKKSVDYNILAGNLDGLNYGYGNIASILMELGDFAGSLDYLQKQMEVAEKIGSVKFMIQAHITLANLYYLMRKFEEGIKHAKKAISLAEKHGDIYDAPDAYYYVAKIYYAEGKVELCAKWAERALEMYREIGIENQASHVYGLLVRCHGRKMLEQMERVIDVIFPEDEYELWMARIIVLAREEREHWAYLDRLMDGMKRMHKLASLVDFLEEYYRITGYDIILKEMEDLKKTFVYPEEKG